MQCKRPLTFLRQVCQSLLTPDIVAEILLAPAVQAGVVPVHLAPRFVAESLSVLETVQPGCHSVVAVAVIEELYYYEEAATVVVRGVRVGGVGGAGAGINLAVGHARVQVPHRICQQH